MMTDEARNRKEAKNRDRRIIKKLKIKQAKDRQLINKHSDYLNFKSKANAKVNADSTMTTK